MKPVNQLFILLHTRRRVHTINSWTPQTNIANEPSKHDILLVTHDTPYATLVRQNCTN